MTRARVRRGTRSIARGERASANKRADAAAVVSSLVRKLSRQEIRVS
jgi:hypothetical protein